MIFCLAVLLSQWESVKAEESVLKAGVKVDATAEAAEVSSVVANVVDHSFRHPDGEMAFTIDLDAWSEDSRGLPIGVFDSGIGGLTVQEAILSLDSFHNGNYSPGPDGLRDFEHEQFIYFGDQANMPYGNYPSAGSQNFLKELILKDAVFLLGRRYWPEPVADHPRFDKPAVKAVVIACNTATAWGLEEIRQAIHAWKIPVIVIGVVEAGALGVMESIDSADPPRTVAVLATTGTCGSNAYPKAINRTTGLAGKRIPDVVQQGSVGLAGAIEGDPAFIATNRSVTTVAQVYSGPSIRHETAKLDQHAMEIYGFDPTGMRGAQDVPESLQLNSVANYVRYDVATLVRNHKASGKTTAIDTVVLGCTHFPLVKQEILSAFADLREYKSNGERPFESLIAECITVVDPAEMTAKELFRAMARQKLFRDSPAGTRPLKDRFFISVPNPGCTEAQKNPNGSLTHDYKYGRQSGLLAVEDTICVPMEISLLPASSTHLIQSRLPEVWARLRSSP
jgi:glutamate racemase